MYPHFIELHTDEGCVGDYQRRKTAPISINVDRIAMIYPNEDGGTMLSAIDADCYQDVIESYDEVKRMIENCGCLIHKGDSRLDNKPLTMADLKNMVGQPVWDSERNVWYLFKTFDDDGQAHFTDVFGNTAIAENEDTLIKYQLYRMKVENDG